MTPLEVLVWGCAMLFWGLLGLFVAIYVFASLRRRWTWAWRRS